MKIFTVRFMWKIKGSDSINFKIVSDTEKGLEFFKSELLKLPDLESAASEYLHEYDVARIGLVDTFFKSDKEEEAL